MVAAPNFNQAAVNDVFASLETLCLQLNRFDTVNKHEPKGAPRTGLACAIWVDGIVPLKRSGLAATSGSLNLRIRIYTPFQQQPYDAIDPTVITAASEIMGAITGDFTFSQVEAIDDNVRGVDLLGGEGSGERLDARAGYLELDRKMYRIMTIRVPIVINDMWTQAA